MFYPDTYTHRNNPDSGVGSRATRHARIVVAVGALLALSACTGGVGGISLPDDPALGGSCTGFAGMTVPNCDFSRPPG